MFTFLLLVVGRRTGSFKLTVVVECIDKIEVKCKEEGKATDANQLLVDCKQALLRNETQFFFKFFFRSVNFY